MRQTTPPGSNRYVTSQSRADRIIVVTTVVPKPRRDGWSMRGPPVSTQDRSRRGPVVLVGCANSQATVTLPDRCLAPAVLINPNGTAAVYIAATGQ